MITNKITEIGGPFENMSFSKKPFEEFRRKKNNTLLA